jgi:AcrR family transcriptional regulator
MGNAERRQRERERRRTEIIDAAEQLFFSRGFDGTTIDEIAEAAELSKGTIYLYFEGKDDLYNAIILRGVGILKKMFEAAVGGSAPGIEKVRAIGNAYIEFFRRYPDYFDALLHHQGAKTETLTEDNPLQIVIDAVRSGIEDGSIRNDLDPMATAILLWGQTTGILQVAFTRCEAIKKKFDIDPKKIISSYFELTYCSLKPE